MEKSAEEIRDSIKAAGLTAISAHVSYDELAGDLEKTLQDYETIGCRYIVIPWLGKTADLEQLYMRKQ